MRALVVASLLLSAASVSASHIGPGCPPPTITSGDGCALRADVDLASLGTLRLESFTSLNCRGRRIYTSQPGTGLAERSRPEVGILLDGAEGVTLQNCVIEGFDFPILAMNSKVPAGADRAWLEHHANDLRGNTVYGRYTGITLIRVDNTRIKDSVITFGTIGGLGIDVLRDSDGNRIVGNTISVAPDAVLAGAPKLPGPVLATNPATGSASGGIYVSQGTGLPNLLNGVVEGELYQFTTPDSVEADDNFASDNLIEDNTIVGGSAMNAVSASVAQRTIVRGNHLGPALLGVVLGAASYDTVQNFSGRCSMDPARACLTSADCSIDAVDHGIGNGTCSGQTTKRVFWITDDAVIEDNVIVGPLLGGIQAATRRPVIRDNDISGPVMPNSNLLNAGGGIDIRRLALDSAIVTRNRVRDTAVPFRIRSSGPPFAATVTLNDFEPGDAPVLVDSATYAAELSALARGNYWGLDCSQSGGFDRWKVIVPSTALVGSDGTFRLVGAPSAVVQDSHPYGVPVARLDESSLPATCPAP